MESSSRKEYLPDKNQENSVTNHQFLKWKKERGDIEWRWNWLKLQTHDIKKQLKECEAKKEEFLVNTQTENELTNTTSPTRDETHTEISNDTSLSNSNSTHHPLFSADSLLTPKSNKKNSNFTKLKNGTNKKQTKKAVKKSNNKKKTNGTTRKTRPPSGRRLKTRTTADYDIDNFIIPFNMSSNTIPSPSIAKEQKHVLTPNWKVIEDDSFYNDIIDSPLPKKTKFNQYDNLNLTQELKIEEMQIEEAHIEKEVEEDEEKLIIENYQKSQNKLDILEQLSQKEYKNGSMSCESLIEEKDSLISFESQNEKILVNISHNTFSEKINGELEVTNIEKNGIHLIEIKNGECEVQNGNIDKDIASPILEGTGKRDSDSGSDTVNEIERNQLANEDDDSSSEDTDDEFYAQRHIPLELQERRKYITPEMEQERLRRQANQQKLTPELARITGIYVTQDALRRSYSRLPSTELKNWGECKKEAQLRASLNNLTSETPLINSEKISRRKTLVFDDVVEGMESDESEEINDESYCEEFYEDDNLEENFFDEDEEEEEDIDQKGKKKITQKKNNKKKPIKKNGVNHNTSSSTNKKKRTAPTKFKGKATNKKRKLSNGRVEKLNSNSNSNLKSNLPSSDFNFYRISRNKEPPIDPKTQQTRNIIYLQRTNK